MCAYNYCNYIIIFPGNLSVIDTKLAISKTNTHVKYDCDCYFCFRNLRGGEGRSIGPPYL